MSRCAIDLHNHSCLSPCGDLAMSPSLLARKAKARGIDILGLSDHNAAHNSLPFALSCAQEGIAPLFGLELCSVEEVHLLAIFPSPRRALEFGRTILGHLPRFPGTEGKFGDQAVVDDEENVLALEETWFGAALYLGFGDLADLAKSVRALVIPAHVDRPMFSVHSQLGFLPPGPYDAIEAVRPPIPDFLAKGHSVIAGSDAHYPEHIGRRPWILDIPEGLLEALNCRLAEFSVQAEALRPEDEAYRGYDGLLEDPRLDAYPEEEALALFEALRAALKSGA
ncbi:MAG: PHP domain-containing protein [Spirochaetes bacterium]|nr:MAG: PHP domain-containing protein [Spirochaetota bacterium]